MRKNLSFILCVWSVFTLAGCLVTRAEVREGEQKKVVQEQVVSLQKSNADSNARIQEYDDQMRNMSGRVDVVENKITIVASETQLNKEHQADLNKKVQFLQDEVIRLDQNVQSLTAELSQLRSQGGGASAKSNAPTDHYAAAQDLFSSKEWKKAILSYQKYRDANPKGKKFADATYKIGVCFQELGLKDEAKTFYDEVVAKFPDEPEAKKAKTRLKSLKK